MDPASPIAPSERIGTIDILRGLALFIVLMINTATEFRVSIFEQFLRGVKSAGLADQISGALVLALHTKGFILFSFLFGVGLAIQFERLAENDRRLALMVRRLARPAGDRRHPPVPDLERRYPDRICARRTDRLAAAVRPTMAAGGGGRVVARALSRKPLAAAADLVPRRLVDRPSCRAGAAGLWRRKLHGNIGVQDRRGPLHRAVARLCPAAHAWAVSARGLGMAHEFLSPDRPEKIPGGGGLPLARARRLDDVRGGEWRRAGLASRLAGTRLPAVAGPACSRRRLRRRDRRSRRARTGAENWSHGPARWVAWHSPTTLPNR